MASCGEPMPRARRGDAREQIEVAPRVVEAASEAGSCSLAAVVVRDHALPPPHDGRGEAYVVGVGGFGQPVEEVDDGSSSGTPARPRARARPRRRRRDPHRRVGSRAARRRARGGEGLPRHGQEVAGRVWPAHREDGARHRTAQRESLPHAGWAPTARRASVSARPPRARAPSTPSVARSSGAWGASWLKAVALVEVSTTYRRSSRRVESTRGRRPDGPRPGSGAGSGRSGRASPPDASRPVLADAVRSMSLVWRVLASKTETFPSTCWSRARGRRRA